MCVCVCVFVCVHKVAPVWVAPAIGARTCEKVMMELTPKKERDRGSERKNVSHPASRCLRGIEETQEGRDP